MQLLKQGLAASSLVHGFEQTQAPSSGGGEAGLHALDRLQRFALDIEISLKKELIRFSRSSHQHTLAEGDALVSPLQ